MLQWESKAENVYSAQSGVTALLRTGQSENLKLWQIFWLHKYWQSFFFFPLFFFYFNISVCVNRQEFVCPVVMHDCVGLLQLQEGKEDDFDFYKIFN